MSFNKVLVEVARRREYKEAAEDIVSGMMAQLQAMTDGRPPFHAFIVNDAPSFHAFVCTYLSLMSINADGVLASYPMKNRGASSS